MQFLVLLNCFTACLGIVKVMQSGWKGSTVRFILISKMIQKLQPRTSYLWIRNLQILELKLKEKKLSYTKPPNFSLVSIRYLIEKYLSTNMSLLFTL